MNLALASAPVARSGPDAAVARGLRGCDGLLAAHLDAVRRRFGAAALGVIDLPDLGEEPVVAAQIRAGAALYWCREIEATGLLQVVEALGRHLANGSLDLALEESAAVLYRMWRQRDERFSAPERSALYAQVFGDGGPEAEGFDVWMTLLVRELVALGRRPGDRTVADLQSRIGVQATNVGRHLSQRSVGIVGFAAREIVQQVRDALDLLRRPDVAVALGGGSPWALVSQWAPTLLNVEVDVHRQIDRAEAGLLVLRWIADAAPDLRGAAHAIERTSEVVAAAERWFAWEGER